MKKLSPVIALSLAILFAFACGGGATAPTPAASAPPPVGKVLAWSGVAHRVMVTKLGLLDSTTTWEISNVTWVRDEDDEVGGLAGGQLFKIASGHVKETIKQITGPCTVTGETEFDLKPGDGRLIVAAGSYSGSISRRGGDEIHVDGDCGFGAGGTNLLSTLELTIDSAGNDGGSASRLRGTKTDTIASSIHVSAWDFRAIAWED